MRTMDHVASVAADRVDGAIRPSSAWLAAALACGVAALFHRLGAYGLWDPDEGRHAEIARELFTASGLHRWVLLTFDGAPYHDKPILYYWLTSWVYALAGVSALSARIVSASSASIVLVATAWWARRHWDTATAVAATLVLASTVEFVALGRYGDLNMLLTLWITLGIVAAHRWAERDGRGWGLAAAAAAAGCGTLTKGFVAPTLIGGTMLAYLTLRGQLRVLRPAPLLRAGVVYVLVTAPWFVAAGIAEPAYLREFLVDHHVQRFLGGARHLHPKPFVFTPLMTLAAFLPWSPLLPVSIGRALRRRGRDAMTDLCLSWAGCVVVFFTCSSGKLGTYVLPAMPPLALLTGRFLAGCGGEEMGAWGRRWTTGALVLIAGLFIAAAPALVWVAQREWGGALAATSWRSLVLVAAGGAIAWPTVAGRPRLAALAVAVATIVSAAGFYGTVAPGVSSLAGDADLARAIRTADPDGTIPVLAYRTNNASLLFHLERPVPRIDAKRRLTAALAAEPETFVVTRAAHLADLPVRLAWVAGGAGGGHAVYAYARPTGRVASAASGAEEALAGEPEPARHEPAR